MLRAEVGTETFWTAIREYYHRYRDQNASTAELRAVFEQESGKELGWFFAQWLTRPGVPKVEGSWRYLPARKAIEVTVMQGQAVEPFSLAVDVGITAKAGDLPEIERIELTGRTATKMISVDGEPAAVTLDPNTWLLMDPARSRSGRRHATHRFELGMLVGATGFEPATFRSQSGRSTRLSHAPTPPHDAQSASRGPRTEPL